MKTILQALKQALAVAAVLQMTGTSFGAVTGQWDFESGDLKATIGQDMSVQDMDTQTNTKFGTTTSFGIPDIGGTAAKVLKFPKTSPWTGGYVVPVGALPNGGGGMVNIYTIIMDVYFPAASSGKVRGLIQTDMTDKADFIVGANNGIGYEGSALHGNVTADTWHRIAVAVDASATPPAVTYYIDGAKVGEETLPAGVDGRWSLYDSVLLMNNDDANETESGYLNSLQVRDEKVNDGFMAALGGPVAGGILTGPPPNPYVTSIEPSPETARFPARSTVVPNPLIQVVIVDGEATVVKASIQLKVDNQVVTAQIEQAGDTTTVSYTPSTLYESGSFHTVALSFNDSAGNALGTQWQFAVGTFLALPLEAANALGSASTAGFNLRTVQAPSEVFNTIPNVYTAWYTLTRGIKQLNGTLTDTNNAVVPNVAYPGPNADGSYDVDGVINFTLNGNAFGNFDSDEVFPGVPGTDSGEHMFAAQVVTYLELTAGIQRLGLSVSADRTDTGSDDLFGLYCGVEARSAVAELIGIYKRGEIPAFASTYNNNEFTVYVPQTGIYPFRLTYVQTGNYASLEMYSVDLETGDKILLNDSANPKAIKAYRVSTAVGSNKPYIAEISPAPGGAGFSPSLPIQVLILDDQTQVDKNSVQLSLNDQVVSAQVTKTGGRTTVFYQPNATRPDETNRVHLVYKDTATPPNTFTADWQFTITVSSGGESVVAGQWDFENGNLEATVGQPLEYFDGAAGQTASKTKFGTTTSFGIADVGGQPANVMSVPGDPNNQIGYIMRHGIPANGGGSRVNQYTLIYDLYWVATGPTASFVNFDLSNTSDGDFFYNGTGFGQGGEGYAGYFPLTPGAWHRVTFAVDMAATPPVVTKYVDGRKFADQVAPNNVLDGQRRSMPLEGAVLFGDGDDGERRACYVSSIQIRPGKLTDAQIAALGGPSAAKIPAAIPPTTVAGQWDFDLAAPNGLAPSIGVPLEYFDGAEGQTAAKTQFGTTTSFGIADIGGQPANVMYVPGDPNNQIGYIMRHGIPANGGGSRVNQYTLVYDIYWVATGPTASFVNFDLSNTSDGDYFYNGTGFGQGGPGYAGYFALTPGAWHRVTFAVDMAATQPVVTKYVDGRKFADQYEPNNVLDGQRRSMPLEGAVLFGDGDDGERRACYVSSIQIRAGKLSDAQVAALGAPSAGKIPAATPATTVTGQWDFDLAAPNGLAPSIGKALEYFDGAEGQTAAKTQFGTTTSFGIADIGGQAANVMYVPGDPNNQIGYIMRHLIAANGGGSRVNQYTLVYDIYWVATGPTASFVNFDLSNTSDGDFFYNGSGFGQGGPGYAGDGVLTPEAWHRVSFAVDMAAAAPVVTKYLDGKKFADQYEPNNVLDGQRRSMPLEGAVLFGDGDDGERRACYVSSIQVSATKFSDAQLEALGGPTADKIPVAVAVQETPPPPQASITLTVGAGTMTLSWDASLTDYVLEGTPSLSTPDWQAVPGVANNSVTVSTSTGTRFYRLRK